MENTAFYLISQVKNVPPVNISESYPCGDSASARDELNLLAKLIGTSDVKLEQKIGTRGNFRINLLDLEREGATKQSTS